MAAERQGFKTNDGGSSKTATNIPPELRAELTFFGGQRILLFRLSLFQLGLVKAGHLCQVWFV